MILPSLLSMGLLWWAIADIRATAVEHLAFPHCIAGGAITAVGFFHLFNPLPPDPFGLGVVLLALGVFLYGASYLYLALFGAGAGDLISLRPLAAFLAKVDVRSTKERVFTIFLALAAVMLWGSIHPIPLGVSGACFIALLLLLFAAGERVYQYAGPVMSFLGAALLLSAYCRAMLVQFASRF